MVELVLGSGLQLPFPDASFDAVCEFGVLHHVEHPNAVVREMLRVSKTAIFLSDTNRFGRGRLFARLVKLALWKLGICSKQKIRQLVADIENKEGMVIKHKERIFAK